jgi:hypothetical protein
LGLFRLLRASDFRISFEIAQNLQDLAKSGRTPAPAAHNIECRVERSIQMVGAQLRQAVGGCEVFARSD